MKTIVCNTCKTPKKADDFYKNKACASGYAGRCKECQNKRQRELYHRNKEERILQITEWKKNNPEKSNAIRRKYWSTYSKKINKKRRVTYQNLSDAYIKQMLRLQSKGTMKDFKPEMIETKRLIIQLKREIK